MDVRAFFESLPGKADPADIAGIDNTYCFIVDPAGTWNVTIRDGQVTVGEGEAPADATFRVSAETFEKLANGKQNPMMAYMTDKLKVDGDLGAATKLQHLF